jgi:hypothetical protein
MPEQRLFARNQQVSDTLALPDNPADGHLGLARAARHLAILARELANFDRALSPEYSTRRPSTKWNLHVYHGARANHGAACGAELFHV